MCFRAALASPMTLSSTSTPKRLDLPRYRCTNTLNRRPTRKGYSLRYPHGRRCSDRHKACSGGAALRPKGASHGLRDKKSLVYLRVEIARMLYFRG